MPPFKQNPASVESKDVTENNQSNTLKNVELDAKYKVPEIMLEKKPDFVELDETGDGSRRFEFKGKKYEAWKSDEGNIVSITPYELNKEGERVYGEPVKDRSEFREVIPVLRAPKYSDLLSFTQKEQERDVQIAERLLQELVTRYDENDAKSLVRYFTRSISDVKQREMAKLVFAKTDTRRLYDAYFTPVHGAPTQTLRNTSFYSELRKLEDARLKSAGDKNGLEGGEI